MVDSARAFSAHAAAHPSDSTPRDAGLGSRVLRWTLRLALLFALALASRWLYASLRDTAQAGGLALIETSSSKIDVGPGWFDPRWRHDIARALASLGPIDPGIPAQVEAVQARLAGLAFVVDVAAVEVLWPDRLRLEFSWAEPVACIHAGVEFLTVTAQGDVLSGRWRKPPGRGQGFLPVVLLGPPSKDERSAREERSVRAVEPGARLLEPSAQDGLAVAASLWRELAPEDVARLGRVVIDARRARRTSPSEPGTVLWLENARRIDFGRSPNLDAPGEQPAAAKWALVSRALALLDPSSGSTEHCDWSKLDVRWDQGALELRSSSPSVPSAPSAIDSALERE